jgi:hypothetical protein
MQNSTAAESSAEMVSVAARVGTSSSAAKQPSSTYCTRLARSRVTTLTSVGSSKSAAGSLGAVLARGTTALEAGRRGT